MTLFDKLLYKWHFTRLNILKTLIFNFKTMPFNTAIKLPVFIYGKMDFYFLSGTVIFEDCEVKKGMIKIGLNKEYLGNVKGNSLIILNRNSKLVFKGDCEFSSGILIRIGNNAQLTFGKNSFIGSSCKIVCIRKVTFGDTLRLGFESQVIDCDFHYIYDLDNGEVSPREKEITIGRYNWIGNRSTISKGTSTNDFTIVGASSILNRNYTKIEDKYVVLAGQPAKQVAQNRRRIFSVDIENELVDYFAKGNSEITQELKDKIEASFNKL